MGIPTTHEPIDTGDLRRNTEVFSIFEVTGWTEYFQPLNGFHLGRTLQFYLNLIETHSEVRGLRIEVTKEIVAEVTSPPQVGRTWFGRKTHNATIVQDFMGAGE